MSVHEMLYVELLPGKEEEFMRPAAAATPGHEDVRCAKESGIHQQLAAPSPPATAPSPSPTSPWTACP